jgi:hypothetical protein
VLIVEKPLAIHDENATFLGLWLHAGIFLQLIAHLITQAEIR